MADYRRYQPRRSNSSSGSWGRWLAVGAVIVIVFFVGKSIFGGKKTSTASNSNTNDTGISLVTDNSNTAVNENTNAGDANANTNGSAVAITNGSWKGFSVTKCPTAISAYGTKKVVVLTIGLSSADEEATQLLDALKAAKVPADFFSTGKFAAANPTLVKSVSTAGFSVYSQSYDSTNLTALSGAELTSVITKAETAISTATGVSTKPIFRPPAGSYNTDTLKALNQQGYCAVLWTVDAYDWDTTMTVETSQSRVLTAIDKSSGGAIVALHAGYDITPSLLTSLVASLKAKGYQFVTLATLLNS